MSILTEITRISNAKTAIINAIKAKNVDIPDNIAIEDIPTYIASITQVMPEFASSIEECTDTSKMYVLPDGYIYAYMTETVTVNPTNRLKKAIASDGTLYNGGKGWKNGYRLNSSGVEGTLSSYNVTGFISAKFGDTLRFKEISSIDNSNTHINFYDASFTHLNMLPNAETRNALNNGIYPITDTLADRALLKSIETMAYFRLSVSSIGDEAMITVNESLEPITTTTQSWRSTGHKLGTM